MRQWNKLLWVMNRAGLRGSTLWVRDCVRTMPNWQHEVVYLHGDEEAFAGEDFRAAGASISHAEKLTREILETIAPSAVVLSNADPASFEGEHPWPWLMHEWPVVSVHHGPVWPWIPGAIADVFVSRALLGMYDGLLRSIRAVYVVPPGIVPRDYAWIQRPAASGRCVIGRHATRDPRKFPAELPELIRAAGCRGSLLGGAEFYPDADRAHFDFPGFESMSASHFLSTIDVFVYRTSLTESWCRAVTEAMAAGLPVVAERRGGIPEQIEDGVTGFLCDSDAEMADRLRLLARNPALRFEMGMRARVAAVTRFEVTRFRDALEPLLLQEALRR